MARLCLVDGTYELFRSFYGAPSRRSESGREVGATLSFARSLASLISSGEFSHFAVAFDTVIESFRNQLFDGYKTGDGIDPELWSQFPLVEEITEALGVPALRMIEFEADDGLATIAHRFAEDPRVERVTIASPDKDLCQCVVGERVVTWDRLRKKTYDEAGVLERLGVRPSSVPDYLALVGDSADGIPGIPRWGAKSAAAALARYPSLEAIRDAGELSDLALRGKASLLENLRAGWDDALLYRTLATLRRDVPLTQELAELAPRDPDRARLHQLAKLHGLPGLPDLRAS